MTVETTSDSQNLLMDVDTMDFVMEGNTGDTYSDDENETFDYDEVIDRDPKSGAPVMSLSKNNAPLPTNGKGKLKYKLGPLSSQNMAYLDESNQYQLLPVKLARVDTSEEYVHYVSKLFEIYRDLGYDRVYSVPTMGVINTTATKEHAAAVNLATSALVTELDFFIDSIKAKKNALTRFSELEECLTILKCLKTIHFTLDTPEDVSVRETFITNLINWINRSDGEPNEEYIEQVFEPTADGKKVFETSFFWKLLNQLLLRGLFDQALGCLDRSQIMEHLNSQCEMSSNALRDLVALLKQYPMDSTDSFREWKSLALELAQTYSGSDTSVSGELRDYIEDTLFLVGGHQSKILHYSTTWYESFCALLLYYIPSLELSEEYLELSLQNHPVDVTSGWEQACVDLIRGRIYSILPVLESLDTCSAAFAAALCEAKGLLERIVDDMETDRDASYEGLEDLFSYRNGMACYMLNNFAFELCSQGDKRLWPIAIGLITLSPVNSTSAKKMAIAELLPHYPFKTNDDIEWMLSILAKWKLPQVAKAVYVTLGNKLLYESNTIEAMANFSKAGKFEWVKRYSWIMFEAAVMQGTPLDDVVLNAIVADEGDSIVPDEILSSLVTSAMKQTLSPYAVLYRFYQAQTSNNWSEALTLLLALIEFPYLPNCYLVMLMARFMYPIFLENDSRHIDESTILRIMESLENKWDDTDAKSINIYSTMLEEGIIRQNSIPPDLTSFLKLIRQKLNLKLCQEFM
ncbi:hypothetical protein ZYGR_0P01180 [Zygosaccharomyces rouxii]|uniref:Nuclear pore complex protein Nup85 n=2 Tax=Zygosaccharomyces rouxii TaxID=4956 RepID=C5E455_ZYGRC|nr:uncharacterized protein ZYRO0E02992g [Zygosaccharomyces rouxii]KAH9198325.1 nucleoporin Nup85-like protein [Zygosaccharomyces rouxii]GAV49474.1 hypothetical protein ZYGR_0P01180 [Zygosaccharomyces rouxii]CAR30816.1 ZYRO0E02992p [Zygosaccharomyces rouxii]